MNLIKNVIEKVPLRTACLFFMLWSNSGYASVGKNAGFYCDDESIKKPYNGDSITAYYLFFVLLGPFAFIVHKCECALEKEKCSKVSKFHLRLHLRHYYSGILYVLAVTEVFKVLFSELRPHFFYTCVPDLSKIDCSKGLITTFNCTGNGPKWLVERDIYKSFPSGHASISFYAFVFISAFLYSKSHVLGNNKNSWLFNFVPVVFFIWTMLCCVSRILDNRHFWWDVLTGCLIGLIGGFIMIKMSLKQAYLHYKTVS